jgi:hypothetical protein
MVFADAPFLPAHISTFVPCAALSTILHNPVLRSELFPMVTPLRWEKWWDRLKQAGALADFYDVPQGICSGFNIGVHEALSSTFTPPNTSSGLENYDIIDNYYAAEEREGRVSAPFEQDLLSSLIGYFRTAPLGVFFRSLTAKPRIIQDHSFPRNDPSVPSVNSQIASSEFPCDWYSFHDCYRLVAAAPPKTEAAVFDVDAAFRRIPLAPEDRPYLCILLKDGTVRIDHVCCFGCRSCPGIFGHVADAIVAIYYFAGIEALLKWVDDFVFFRYAHFNHSTCSWSYKYDATLIWTIADELGWPWAPKKFIDFSETFPYVGFVWDMKSRVVYLSAEKRAKFVERLAPWVTGNMVSKEDCDVMLGTLNHCALVLPDGRSRLPSLYRLAGSFKNAHYNVKHKVSASAAADLDWWRSALSSAVCSLAIREIPAPSVCEIHVDASTSWGIGFVWQGKWLAWKLKAGWKAEGRDIGWAEMVAVYLAVTVLVAAGLCHAHFILRSDNAGVCGATVAGKSRNAAQNEILRRTVDLFRDHDLTLTVKWISTVENLADAPSRGALPGAVDLFPCIPTLPFHLRKLVEKPVRAETYPHYKTRM